ncbi:chitin-inducible gibberellin-responsive protein 1-like isoform X2 [Ananas comosus]|uniref:Chitin-inducible gibberellin-responsive protein 1-like isoform X2 n=2 Tax=Ananas comosus TaxID=4615 RepID=A0A6P5FQQ5_ANACO|nr:chitin-inducible gibberellin-responsive protein 1-like isoform X2 [Ananas comosus]
MDLHQLLKYGLTASDHSCEFPAPRTPAYSDCSSISKQRSPIESLSGNIHSQHSPLEPGSSLRQFQIKFSEFTEPNSQNTITSQNMRHALQELETVLMAPDTDEGATSTNPNTDEHKPAKVARQLSRTWSHESRREPIIMVQPQFTSNRYPVQSFEVRPEKRPREMKEDPQNKVKQLLIKCAEALSENKIEEFDALVQEAHGMVSISGEPIQRLGAYLIEGLVARKESSGTNIYRALKCREPESTELLSYMRTLYDICPYFKFGYMAANGAIAEALRSEDRIHIIDFQIAQGTQWITLIQALAARPGGPPHVRITGIDDPLSEYARGDGLQLVGKMLSDMSKKFNIPLEFTGLPVYCPQVTREMLDIRPGEALAVNFTLHLHHTPDESVDVSNPRDGLLRMVKGLSPKVTTLVEQESNTNTTPFLTRFLETLDYYYAMFESIDVTLPRDSKERISVEQHCLAKDIVNIIACEGDGRVERHELLGKWRSRLTMAGFKPYPLSSYVNSVIKKLLGFYSDKYTLVEKDGAMLLGWKNRSLISASAWH